MDQRVISNSSIENNKQLLKKSLNKNHSEYFITNPQVREIVENSSKYFRNKASQLVKGFVSKKASFTKSPDKNVPKNNLY